MAKCIMVVDDEPSMRKVLKQTLQMGGYEVLLAEGGEQALELFDENDPDLIILDIKMPKINGFQVLKAIRKTSNVPVIMLSGMGEVTNIHDALSIGADDFIKKPFHMNELLARVKVKLRRTTESQ
ncbi:MAG: response regulator [Dehalococcoidales bacterium]|nr:response regulator [Dehalococcoidales bacterium]